MRKLILPLIFLVLVSLSSLAFAGNNENVNWKKFSDNLTKSLKSENIGVRLSAMQLIIRYSDKIDVTDGVFDVMREFRNNDDQNIRKLALITLYKMNDNWAIEFLKMQHQYEENQDIKNKIEHIVYAYENNNQEQLAQVVNNLYLSLKL